MHRHLLVDRLRDRVSFLALESQAHRFAAAFLLPAAEFVRDFVSPTLDSLMHLKRKWRVSIAMMIKRCETLNLVSDPRRLWIALSRRQWRTREPFDDELQPEQPRLLYRAIDLLTSADGGLTNEHLLWSLPFAPADIERLAGLPAGFLTQSKESSSSVSVSLRTNQSGVLSFPHHGNKGESRVVNPATNFENKGSKMSKSTRNTGKAWTPADVRQLRVLAAGNTPTPVIGLKLGRTPDAVRTKASNEGVSLKPTNQSPYNRRPR